MWELGLKRSAVVLYSYNEEFDLSSPSIGLVGVEPTAEEIEKQTVLRRKCK